MIHQRREGQISEAAAIASFPSVLAPASVYAATKAALRSLGRTLETELAP